MSEAVIFMGQGPIWPVLLAAGLLLALFVMKEWRQGGSGFALKVAAAVVALSALACLVLKPATIRTLEGGKALVLTPGYDPLQRDSLVGKNRGIRQITYKPGSPLNLAPSEQSVLVLGYGLQPYDLWELRDRAVVFLPPSRPEGILGLQTHSEPVLGGELRIRGLYNAPAGGNRLLLRDPGGNPCDSVALSAEPEQEFSLQAKPRAAGRFTYYLEEQDSSGAVLRSDPVPVEVSAPRPVRVLILNAFPTFETRYLKNFLADKGNALLVRTQLTRGAYKFEYYNREAEPVYGLTREVLQSFDLVVADTDSYLGLGRSSRAALDRQLETGALGLLIQPDDRYFGLPKAQTHFAYRPDPGNAVPLGAEGQPVAEKYPYTWNTDLLVRPVKLPGGITVGAYRPLGRGRVVATTLRDTYRLLLEGETMVYQALWSALISAGVQREARARWEPGSRIPRADEPFGFWLHTEAEAPRVSNAQGAILPLMQDALVPTRWEGTDYPRNPGWNRLRLASDSIQGMAYYVYEGDHWQAIRDNATLEDNQRLASSGDAGGRTLRGYRPVAPVWFYALFLLGMGWLWLEPRLTQR